MAYIGKEPANIGQRPIEDTFTATASQTVFTLTADVDYESDIFVSVNGVVQANSAFTLSGTGSRTLTFATGITNGHIVRVVHHTNANTITAAITFAGTENGITAGPVTFSGSGSVTVTTGSTWHLLV